jgi:hypothetical protein
MASNGFAPYFSFDDLEEPFERVRKEIRDLIDFVIYIHVEPEIVLGTRIHD